MMSTFPQEIQPFLSFFKIQPAPTPPGKFLETIGRIHGLTLIAMKQLRNPLFEEQFVQEDHFFKVYLDTLNMGAEPSHEQPLQQVILEFIQTTLGTGYRYSVDSSQKLTLQTQNATHDLYPFFIVRGTEVFWMARCRTGILTYVDPSGVALNVEPGQPMFYELIEGLMDRGWYRVVLKVLADLPESSRKPFENKIYSAHCYLGCDLYKAKRYQEAIAEFENAMKMKSNMPQLFYNLALSYARTKSYRRAIQLLNQLNRIKPDEMKTFELLGDFYSQLGEWDRSLMLYQRAEEFAESKIALASKIQRLEEKFPKTKPSEAKKDDDKEDKFSLQSCLQDLTLEAELGRIQPAIGREKELLQMQEILACHSKKNVLVLGDPGVGKTALICELAYRMVAGTVNPRLRNKKLMRINIGNLLAGAKFRGQFEERLMHLVRELKKQSCILFIDDIHQIVSGSSSKTSSTEASHFIKPALMNDELQIIGASNYEDFRNSIEKDSSFLRCFQTVKLDEPDDDTLMKILLAYRAKLENYHNVLIHEESLETTLMWVKVLLRERALPDKALDILDRSAARISIQEKAAIVSSESVLETISEISNIPVNRMSVSETVHYRNIESSLSRRVVGQLQAVNNVSKVLCTSKLRMNLNPSRPQGIFLFVGPTGVGKTELAKGMAEFLFGHEDKIIRIDMSEYMERYSASRLIGTSPGYVGYYDQNQLVDKIRANPYSLILLDEIEKADSQLLNLFLQVFDAGRLTDGKGKIAYFDNATIVMTSNIGTHLFAQNKLGYGSDQPEGHVTRSDLLKEVKRFFQPEFLNRIDEIVFFKPLSLNDVRDIANKKLTSILEQLEKQDKKLILPDETLTQLCKIGYDYEYGARNLERVLRRFLLDQLAQSALHEDWPAIRTIVAEWQNEEIVLKTSGSSGLQEVLNSTLEQQNYLEE